MEHRCPSVLLTGYENDMAAVAAKLGEYPGRLYTADEETMLLRDEWNGAVVAYVCSHATRYSSQLKSVFSYLHDWLKPRRETVILLEGMRPDEVNFPELDAVSRTPLDGLARYLADVK
jgi:hypothetical protein